MSWEKGHDAETLKKMLADVWQDVPSILDAPSFRDLTFHEGTEEEKLYKAIDNKGGIYLVQNPALMVAQTTRGDSPIRRMKPKKMLTPEEAKSEKNKYRHQAFDGKEQTRGVQI